jgi:hypothetical protein
MLVHHHAVDRAIETVWNTASRRKSGGCPVAQHGGGQALVFGKDAGLVQTQSSPIEKIAYINRSVKFMTSTRAQGNGSDLRALVPKYAPIAQGVRLVVYGIPFGTGLDP